MHERSVTPHNDWWGLEDHHLPQEEMRRRGTERKVKETSHDWPEQTHLLNLLGRYMNGFLCHLQRGAVLGKGNVLHRRPAQRRPPGDESPAQLDRTSQPEKHTKGVCGMCVVGREEGRNTHTHTHIHTYVPLHVQGFKHTPGMG